MSTTIEKLVINYLDSSFGENPKLKVKNVKIHISRNFKPIKKYFSINGIKIGSITSQETKISVDVNLYNTLRKLFGTSPIETKNYVNKWFTSLTYNEQTNIRIPK